MVLLKRLMTYLERNLCSVSYYCDIKSGCHYKQLLDNERDSESNKCPSEPGKISRKNFIYLFLAYLVYQWLDNYSSQFVKSDEDNETNNCPGGTNAISWDELHCLGFSYTSSELDGNAMQFINANEIGETTVLFWWLSW